MMNGHLNKVQYKFFKEHLKKDLGQVKSNKSCEWIVNTHRLGRIANGVWIYTEQDRISIINLVKQLHHCDLLIDPFPEKQSRIEQAHTYTNEKHNSLAVSHDFVLVNSLQTLLLNQQSTDLTGFATLGVYLNVNSIKSIEHENIIMVENLAVMANLQQLVFMDNAKHLADALWVYRGDIKTEQNTGQAYAFFRRYIDTHSLICFSDFDPEGLSIAFKSGASQYLAPNMDALKAVNLTGAEQDYYNQIKTVNLMSKKTDLSVQCRALLIAMSSNKKTIKQEHLLSHQIPLSLVDLKD